MIMFAKHAKRSVVQIEDVLLVSLLELESLFSETYQSFTGSVVRETQPISYREHRIFHDRQQPQVQGEGEERRCEIIQGNVTS